MWASVELGLKARARLDFQASFVSQLEQAGTPPLVYHGPVEGQLRTLMHMPAPRIMRPMVASRAAALLYARRALFRPWPGQPWKPSPAA